MGCVNGKSAEKIEEKQVKIWYNSETEKEYEDINEYGVRTTLSTIEEGEEGEEEEEV